MSNVRDNQIQRYLWWCREKPDEIIHTLTAKINKMHRKYLRVFDSGDFQSIKDIHLWHEVVTKCPGVKFWFSTKSWIRKDFCQALLELNSEPNAVVRRSALFLDKPASKHAIKTTAEVHTAGKGCPKQLKGSCDKAGCRDCWNKEVLTVVYKLHGYQARWK